ncbi:MAG: hypothetical protein IPJ03_07805 [Ignavibacteriales bacterium]|nr:hypothetical protein [Ignavibacteriales bacterium]
MKKKVFTKRKNNYHPQSAHIAVTTGQKVLNMHANNYLGLADNPEIIQAAKKL